MTLPNHPVQCSLLINIGMLVYPVGSLCTLLTKSLESHNPRQDKIYCPSKVNAYTASMYSKTILPTRDTGDPIILQFHLLVLLLIAISCKGVLLYNRATEVTNLLVN